MSKPWGGLGAWAADAERAEAEENERQAAAEAAGGESQSFPSLKEAAAAKPKKKKGTPMTLSEFTTGNYVGPGRGGRRDPFLEPKGLTPEEMLALPTRPKERSAEEMEYGRLGGGFRSYGRSSGPPSGRTRDRGDYDNEGSWGGGGGGSGRRSYGGFEEERSRPPPRFSEFDQPSRADEADNWASMKRPIAVTQMDSGRQDRYGSDSGRQDRYGSLGGGGGGGSRADEVDNWTATKKPLPAARSSGGFGTGFRDSIPDSDRWSRGGLRDGEQERPRDGRERPRLVLDQPRGEAVLTEPVKSRPSPFGAARPREEVLAEKGLDWKKLDSESDLRKMSRPTSSQSSRPSSAHSSRPGSPPPQALVEGVARPRPKVNPFGAAKPREVVLKEQGKDWRKIDLELEHRGVDRPETEGEKVLKEEINHLNELMKEAEAKMIGESVPVNAEECIGLREQIRVKENDLERLIHELDDKVRFGQRPGSGAGRIASFPDRPPSQSGVPEEPGSMEFMERPRSRGSDVWSRSGDDRSFSSGRERGFFANRDMDRSKSRERW
ncbi:hypothetical protein AAC387_Pa05g0853 [Persea americana]